MKKGLLILGTALMTTLGLVACQGNEEQPAGNYVKINIWATAAEQQVIDAVVSDYNKKQTDESAKFQYTFTAVSESDAGTTLAKDPTVDEAPALFLCADDHIYNLQSKNIVAELKGSRKEKVVANNSAVAVAGATLDDKLYGYPVTSDNGYFLWYNSGVEGIKDKVGSLEGLLALAKSLGKKVLMDVPNGWYANSFIMSPQACGVKSLYWQKDGEKVKYVTNWDNDVGVKVSEYIAGLLTPYYADQTLVTGSNDAISAGFQDGSMIAAVSGTWMESELKPTLGDKLAATKLPSYKIGETAYQMASFTGSKVYCINKTRSVDEQRTAAALAELLTSKDAQLVRFEKRQSLPCNNDAIKDKKYTENSTIGGAALVAQNAYACVQAQTAQDRYWDIGKAIGQAYIDGQLGEAKTWKVFLKQQMDTLRVAQ